MAKVISLVVKLGALIFILFLPTQYAIDLPRTAKSGVLSIALSRKRLASRWLIPISGEMSWLPGTYGITSSADIPQPVQPKNYSSTEDLSQPDHSGLGVVSDVLETSTTMTIMRAMDILVEARSVSPAVTAQPGFQTLRASISALSQVLSFAANWRSIRWSVSRMSLKTSTVGSLTVVAVVA